jgi:pimeloyl-ACP methyl ester carboxylesterase
LDSFSLGGSTSSLTLNGVEIALTRRGAGAPLLLLPSEDGTEAGSPLVDALAKGFEVLIPDAPGFGASPDADRITTVDDIAYLYLDLIDRLKLRDVALVGFSLGGWIAAEMATKSCQNLRALALVAPYGIKIGGPFDRDIADIYYLSRDEVTARTYADATELCRDG